MMTCHFSHTKRLLWCFYVLLINHNVSISIHTRYDHLHIFHLPILILYIFITYAPVFNLIFYFPIFIFIRLCSSSISPTSLLSLHLHVLNLVSTLYSQNEPLDLRHPPCNYNTSSFHIQSIQISHQIVTSLNIKEACSGKF